MKTVVDLDTKLLFCFYFAGILFLFAMYGGVMGVKAAKKKKKLKFKPIIKEFRVSTRTEAVQVCNLY